MKIDRHRDVSFGVTSKELTLDIKDFSTRLISPAMRAIAQAVDEDLLNEVSNISATVSGTASPTDLKDIADAVQGPGHRQGPHGSAPPGSGSQP